MKRRVLISLVALVCLLSASGQVFAIPPTEEAVEKWKAEGVWEQKIARWETFKAQGGCAPSEFPAFNKNRMRASITSGSSAVVETLVVPVILVDFADYKFNDTAYSPNGPTLISSRVASTAQSFDSLLFSLKTDSIFNPTGSMTEFYLENSNNRLFVTGRVLGWYTAPQDYTFYEGGNDGLGSGGSLLARDAVIAADNAGADFGVFDPDGDKQIPGVIIVHAGPGAETGAWGIWSHKSGYSGPLVNDSLYILNYSMNPEEQGANISNMGVFGHEFGHILGAPDVYDLSGRAAGLGVWSMMAGGSWNQGGRLPCHLDAYCKIVTGLALPTDIDANVANIQIPQTTDQNVILRLRNPLISTTQSWFIENRQRVGFDASLPAGGLVIYHFDGGAGSQTNPARYLISLEQADGLAQMNDTTSSGNGGDAGDCWPGATNKREWTDFTTPNSRTNVTNLQTQFGLWNISNPGPIMTCDIDTAFSRPWILLDSLRFTDTASGGDGDGILEAGERLKFSLKAHNPALICHSPTVTLTCDNPDVVISGPRRMKSHLAWHLGVISLDTPYIDINLPLDFESASVTFTATITGDSAIGSGDRKFQKVFTFERNLGAPQILIVDHDNNSTTQYDRRIGTVLESFNRPYDRYARDSLGAPTGTLLKKYRYVFWVTGTDNSNPSTLNTSDVAAMKEYLDAGGSICLSSITAPQRLKTIDSNFIMNYFKVRPTTMAFRQQFRGVAGTEIGEGTRYRVTTGVSGNHSVLEVLPDGQRMFYLGDNTPTNDYGTCGVLYQGSYQAMITSFGIETLSDANPTQGIFPRDTLIGRILEAFKEGAPTSVDDEQNGALPNDFVLEQNYPNPFNPSTTISYTIKPVTRARLADVTLAVYNVIGQRVTTLVDKVQAPGNYTVSWDGTNSAGEKVSSGLYFYRLDYQGRTESKKMVLLK